MAGGAARAGYGFARSLRVAPDGRGTLIDVKVVPGASRSRIAGLHGESLKVQVAAPPERGRANDAVCEVLAAALGLPRRSVSVFRGESAPRKTLYVDGLLPAEIASRIRAR